MTRQEAPAGGKAGSIWDRRGVYAAAWVATFVCCVALVWTTGYRVHDADSKLYAEMAADLAQRPWAEWCAPVWGGHWQRHGLFFEHPPGLLWAGAGLIRLGFPAFCALYVINFMAFFGSLALLWQLGLSLGGGALGGLAVALWVTTPAFLQYLVRGDQEHPLTCAILLGLVALIRLRHPVVKAVAWAAALACAIVVKGISGLALLPIGALYWLLYDRKARGAWPCILGTCVVVAAGWGFDIWYTAVTGTGFWVHYWQGQVAMSVGQPAGWWMKIQNLSYYLARPAWFALPVMLTFAAILLRRRPAIRLTGKAWGLGWVVALVFIGGFSLADRKADRYLFPMYPVLALSAGWLLLQASQRWSRWVHRTAFAYAMMLGLVIGVGLKIYIGTYHYTFIRLWPGA